MVWGISKLPEATGVRFGDGSLSHYVEHVKNFKNKNFGDIAVYGLYRILYANQLQHRKCSKAILR
jgi:hypothetical protein